MAIFGGGSADPGDRDDAGPLRSRAFVASAIVLAAVVVCGIALLLLDESGTPTGTPSPGPTATTEDGIVEPSAGPVQTPPATEPTPVEPPGSPAEQPTEQPTEPPIGTGPCRMPAGDQRIVSTAPSGVRWRFESSMLIPTRTDVGPGAKDSRGILRCFARSPIGSVFAAMAILAQVQDETSAARVIEARVAPGPGRTVALTEARRLSAAPGRANAEVQFVGFKIVDYTADRAIVSVAVETGPDRIAGLLLAMRWTAGDWRMELRPDGSIGGDPDVLASLDGYVRFRGA